MKNLYTTSELGLGLEKMICKDDIYGKSMSKSGIDINYCKP